MGRLELSFTELDLLGDVLGLDVRPFPFTFPSAGRDWDTRLGAGLRANEAMIERGLVRDGRFIPELERAVTLLARGQVGVGVIGTGDRGEIIARATTDGRAAMIAQQWGDGVRVALGRAEGLVPWLLGLLPRYPRGTGDSATISVPATAAAARALDDDFAEFSHIGPVRAARSTRERDREAATRILASKQLGSGYFLVDGSSGVQHTLNWV
ncbi:MAG: ESX secretion-associated protein EspG, partial [Sciscionella sp.]